MPFIKILSDFSSSFMPTHSGVLHILHVMNNMKCDCHFSVTVSREGLYNIQGKVQAKNAGADEKLKPFYPVLPHGSFWFCELCCHNTNGWRETLLMGYVPGFRSLQYKRASCFIGSE